MELATMMDALSGRHHANGQDPAMQGDNARPANFFGLLGEAAMGSQDDDYILLQDIPEEHQKEWNGIPAIWLDAMPPEMYEEKVAVADEISAVNSDDNGLYRMFRSFSP